VDVINVGLQVAFAAVFVVVLQRYVQDRRPVNRDLTLVAGAVAGWFLVSTAVSLIPALPDELSRLSTVFILAQPILTLRLIAHFVPVQRNVLLAAVAWYVVALAVSFGVGTRGNVLATTIVVTYFVVFQAGAAIILGGVAEGRVGYARTRLRIAAVGTLLFGATIFIAGVANAMAAPDGALDSDLVFVSRLVALIAGLSYLAAFMPPQPLRRLQERAIAFDLGQELMATPDGDLDGPWKALAAAAERITGARAVVVETGMPRIVRASTGQAPPDGDATFAVPIENDGPVGVMLVYLEEGSLFVEDDRSLLRLLAGQAARSAEQQVAVLERNVLESELESASQELEESRAQLESEARFRVALEAHPGILLVVDPDGSIGYANEQALASLGYDRESIKTTRLSDLLTTSAPVGVSTHGVMPAEARRRDGTVFPVDYAVSTFDSGGERYSMAVLTDISDRLQTERLRDTFIGMLSHELRTPVTSIYGGSQVLLNRGDRLDRSTRRELIADVASESERLHRLIENLLVLARVERGQDLAGGEPVLLQRVLPVIVERERALWPGTQIDMVIPPGLATVRGHDGYVGQVVRNLLSNAAKYAGEGSQVRIVAEGGERGVTVRVLDDGAGIQAEHADHLFDLYYRAPGAADRAPGAGIGLFVCRHIVSALGGTIWARPRPEGGSEFGFELPIYEPEDEPSAIDTEEPGVAAVP
jgi:PAS domain S-box-containing protein